MSRVLFPGGEETGRTLIVTVGLPRSGKTTWARSQKHPIVCPDSIRLALHRQRYVEDAEAFVWAIARVMVKSLFYAGHKTVIVDACSNTRKRRDAWISESWMTAFKVIDTSVELCLHRAIEEGDGYIIPIIERMAAESEPLGPDERKES